MSVYYNVPVNYLMGFTDAMNPENSSIVDRTGLSEETVSVLMNEYEDGYIANVLDKLIRNENFRYVLPLIECESHSSGNHWDGTEIFRPKYKRVAPSYSVYIIEKLLMEAILSVLEDRSGEIAEEIINTLLSKKEKEEYFKWVFDPERDNKLKERWEQIDKETA